MIALRLGLAYFAAVFAAGFVLGALRVLAVAPRLGETGAVVLELPVMLAVSWLVCGRLLRGRRLSAGQALAMGGVAFACLMLAEAGLSVLAFGRSLATHIALYAELPHRIGLAGQAAFAALPLLRR